MDGVVGNLEKINNHLARIALALEGLRNLCETQGIKTRKDKEYNYRRP